MTLLTIPAEIRSIIIEIAILSKCPAPKDLESAVATHQPLQSDTYYRQLRAQFNTWPPGPRHIRFEEQPKGSAHYTSNALPLLLTNRQINAETRSPIKRLGEKVRHYELDIMVSTEFWSTWTCVPVLSDRVDRVDATFRVDRMPASAFRVGNGSPPSIHWYFYFLLEHFLKRGPISPTSVTIDRQVSIQVLNLNFVACNESPQQAKGNDLVLKLAKEAVGAFRRLIGMGYHTALHGAIVYERVGLVRFCVDGQLIRETNLGPILASFSCNDPQYTFGLAREKRVAAFWEWKENATRLRMERGFK
uniref:Uncharacterized protein n=1 Tax=Moniliophthora roreri TaxID=221103 RepID=A0A0W0FV68_MONRR